MSEFVFDSAPRNCWLVFRSCSNQWEYTGNYETIIEAREWISCSRMEKKHDRASFRIYVEVNEADVLFDGACPTPFRTFTFVEGINAKYNHTKHDDAFFWCIKGDKLPFLFTHYLGSEWTCSS